MLVFKQLFTFLKLCCSINNNPICENYIFFLLKVSSHWQSLIAKTLTIAMLVYLPQLSFKVLTINKNNPICQMQILLKSSVMLGLEYLNRITLTFEYSSIICIFIFKALLQYQQSDDLVVTLAPCANATQYLEIIRFIPFPPRSQVR